MNDDVQDVLQGTEWPFTERRRRRFIAMQTKEATQLQIRNQADLLESQCVCVMIVWQLLFRIQLETICCPLRI